MNFAHEFSGFVDRYQHQAVFLHIIEQVCYL